MTQAELAERVRSHVCGSIGEEFARDGKQPFGLTIPEANVAMLEGLTLALADMVMASTKRTSESRAYVTRWAANRLATRVEALQTEGSA